jgi:hypothetical protein
VIAAQSLYKRFAIVSQSLCDRFVNAPESLFKRFAIIIPLQTLYNYNRFANALRLIPLQTLYNRFTIAL